MINWDSTIELCSILADKAPSSHNSKPWTKPAIQALHDGTHCTVAFGLDLARVLGANENVAREMLITLGCHLALFEDAMKLLGCERVSIQATQGGSIKWWSRRIVDMKGRAAHEPVFTATYAQRQSQESDLRELTAALQRRTYRGTFSTPPTAKRQSATPVLEPAHNQLHLFGPKGLEGWLKIYCAFGYRDFSDSEVWGETYEWIHRSDKLRNAEVGLRADEILGKATTAQGIINRTLLFPRYIPRIIRETVARRRADATAQAVVGGNGILVAFCRDDRELLELISIGTKVFQAWTHLEQAGFSLWPISVLTQHDDSRHALQHQLGSHEPPVFCAPFGTPSHTKRKEAE